MTKGRMEAFSDGVFAIIITIMVLEFKVPRGDGLEDLLPLWPTASSYVLSFVYLGIYWNNHHHLLQAASHVGGAVLWANLHLLFWLSLLPFATAWMGTHSFASVPVMLYGFVMLMAAIAYYILTRLLIRRHGGESTIARAIGNDLKGKASLVLYLVALPISHVLPLAALGLFTVVAVMWLIPDRRIEKKLEAS